MVDFGGDVQSCYYANMGKFNGGAGGNGSVTVTNLMAELNYDEKEIELNLGQTYKIDTSKIQLVNYNSKQVSNNINLGNISYEILDTAIATVDGNGNILAKTEGITKLRIKDNTNNLETYIYITVVDGIKTKLTVGNNFTVALKNNGTVWSYRNK